MRPAARLVMRLVGHRLRAQNSVSFVDGTLLNIWEMATSTREMGWLDCVWIEAGMMENGKSTRTASYIRSLDSSAPINLFQYGRI
jgi:hypothetical protein